jgi:hypothetical protein
LSQEAQDALKKAAADLIESRGLIMMIVDAIGSFAGTVGGAGSKLLKEQFGFDLSEKVEGIVEEALWKLQSGAIRGMDYDGEEERWGWFHKLVASASGASAGFVGAPGLLWDLPITTGIIMRSVADIARSFPGERLDSDDTKRACIEVFALGGPETNDDDADMGYWAARATINHVTIEAVIRKAAERFSVVVSEKFVSQAVPGIGAIAGGGLNYVFISYYQQMARVHFTVRRAEREAADPSAVRACFSAQVRRIKSERKIRKPKDE